MSSHKYGDESTYIEIKEEGKRLIKEGHLPIHGDFMTGELVIPKKVWLTVEEAKQLQKDFLDIVCEIVRLVGRFGVKYEKPSSLIMLEDRIEQAEKKQ